MKKICLISVYFGKLPKYFQLWLDSCKGNPNVDFLVFIDDRTEFRYPDNVKRYFMSFEEVRTRFQLLFDFKIQLNTPYKLCDYKPAYGEAFIDYIDGYDFWGYCDIDIIWGDIRKYITEEKLSKYDRILTRGHCSFFRNTPIINSLYRTLEVEGCQNYRNVYQSDESHCFDEWAGHCGWGISEIFRRSGILQYDDIVFASPNFLKRKFVLDHNDNSKYKNRVFVYDNGKLYMYYSIEKNVYRKEYMYCHFQKRNLVISKLNIADKFILYPPNIVTSYQSNLSYSDLKKYQMKKILYTFPFKFRIQQLEKYFRLLKSKKLYKQLYR